MTTFEVDAIVTIDADSDEGAENAIKDILEEVPQIKSVEVAHIMDTTTYGR